jgi:hypothetical protein
MRRSIQGIAALAVVFVACSGSVETQDGGGGSGGSSGSGGATGAGGSSGSGGSVFPSGDATDGTSGGGSCPGAPPSNAKESFTVGSSAKVCPIGRAAPFQVGSAESGVMGATVTCSVAAAGAGFSVQADVVAGGATFKLSGHMPSSGTTDGMTVSFTAQMGKLDIDLSQSNCTVTLADAETPGFDPSDGPPIAAGRVWATATCDDMAFAGSPGGTCPGNFTLRLENCAGTPACP